MEKIKSPKRAASPSAHDVAALAGVSQAAVSRAFTPGASISKETRERVLKAAQKLDYRPNLLARSLNMGRSGIIGVVLGNTKNPFYVNAFEALSTQLQHERKHTLVFTGKEYSTADVQVEDLLKYRVDALLLMAATLSSKLADHCRTAGIPIFFVNSWARKMDGIQIVSGDNRKGARQIAQHLLQQGYERLAYIAGCADCSANRERESAFKAYLSGQGLPPPQRAVGYFRRDGAMEAARSLLAQKSRPDAIFCANDYMALAAIEVARFEFGLEIGRDLGVAGFDDIEQAAWPSFDLTTYSQPIDATIDQLTALLTDEPKLKRAGQTIVPGELKCRGSTTRK